MKYLLEFLCYITRKARTEPDFANWFLKIFINKNIYTSTVLVYIKLSKQIFIFLFL